MRMARVNITIPDDALGQARAAGLNVSWPAATALAAELERRAKIAELDAYLADLGAEQDQSLRRSLLPPASGRTRY